MIIIRRSEISIADVFHKSEATFAELKESKEKEQLQQFAFITLLGYDIYLRKQVIEKMIDETLSTRVKQ